ncbi:hypothetical protein [Clostridium mediterraneense]|uniref:hypothetical protein n=1 Tax=Clostridium mediterraneense TaxID=1805472 RepID=UPI0008356255|nr:hypothetical protein [Clostridium mediterraneense]
MKLISKIIGFIICLCLSISFISCMQVKKEDVMNELDRGEYSKVLNDMNGLSVQERKQVQDSAINKISDITQGVKSGKIMYSDAIQDLNDLRKIVPQQDESKVTDAIQYVRSLENQGQVK